MNKYNQDTIPVIAELLQAKTLLKKVFILLNDDFIQNDERQKEFKRLETDIGEFLKE